MIAPHPDDELFATAIIRDLQRQGYSVKIATFYLDKKRNDEFKRATCRLSCDCLRINNGECYDGKYHEKALVLKESLEQVYHAGYKTFIIPILEGGHQDHDTIAAILSKILISQDRLSDAIYYSTYFSAYRQLYFTHRSRAPRNYMGFRRANLFSNARELATILHLWITCYPSQTKSLLLLLPTLIARIFANRFHGFVIHDTIRYKNIDDIIELSTILRTGEGPLYEFHNRITYSEWCKSIACLNDQT